MYILALDDEKYVLSLLVQELKKVFPDATIHEETRAASAMVWAEELAAEGKTLSYAFLDIQMRGMNGIEAARRLKTLQPDVMLFFCTAHSEYAIDAFGLHAKGYLLKPIMAENIESVLDAMVVDWRSSVSSQSKRVRIQTFGSFNVYVDDTAIKFEREKAKELLAFLVDRHGAGVTTEQISMMLWENETYDRKVKNKTTTIISSLRRTLRETGIDDILVKTWNHLALDIHKVICDSYDFERGDLVAINSFRGDYMTDYSWAEFTNGYYTMMDERRNKE